jgi:trans-2,3-dihydro-3-hydroxyanthranilate isomerase
MITIGQEVAVDRVAAALGLSAVQVETATHPPQVASVGLPFVIVELIDRDALEHARANPLILEEFRDEGLPLDIHIYVRSGDDFDIRCRMFAPLDGIAEDPACASSSMRLARDRLLRLRVHSSHGGLTSIPSKRAATRWRSLT